MSPSPSLTPLARRSRTSSCSDRPSTSIHHKPILSSPYHPQCPLNIEVALLYPLQLTRPTAPSADPTLPPNPLPPPPKTFLTSRHSWWLHCTESTRSFGRTGTISDAGCSLTKFDTWSSSFIVPQRLSFDIRNPPTQLSRLISE